METESLLAKLQYRITQDRKFVFTALSYVTIFLIFVNMSLINSPAIGIVASAIFLVINATCLGHALFERENALVRFLLGTLLLIVILGLVAWAVMILYSLNTLGSVTVLLITSSLASFLNIKVKSKNASP